VDTRSDLYSVGVILYELLTGHTPFNSESGEFTEILFKLFTADPPPVKSTRPDLPDPLAAAVHKALARDVDQRFSSALEMAEALAPFASERSSHVLTRMRAFKAPAKGSIAPPEDLPQSMVAFSELSHHHAGHATDVMAHRPTTDVMKGPPVTELLAHAPGRVPALQPNQTGRLQAAPEAFEARARPEDANARTQYDQHPPSVIPKPMPPAGASTDLGAARSVMTELEPPPKKRSPLVFALPVVAVLVIVGGALGLAKSASKDKTVATSVPSVTAPVTTPALPASTPEALAVTAPPASLATAPTAPSASASASASAAALRPPPQRPGPGPRVPPPPGPGVLETKIKE
jgi:serine/threonine-protein kinase